MNRGQLVNRVARKTGLSTDTGSDDLAFLQDLANQAVIDVLQRTHVFLTMGEMTLISGQAEYRLDSNILAIDEGRTTTAAGQGNFIIVTLEELIRQQSAGFVSDSARKYISFDGSLMIVSPTPTTSSEVIRFYYVPMPTSMSNDTDDPSTETFGGIPVWGHRALEYYMLWQCAEDVEKQRPMGPNDYFQVYLGECKEIRKRKRGLGGRRMGPARAGYPDQRREPLRNDVYPQYRR